MRATEVVIRMGYRWGHCPMAEGPVGVDGAHLVPGRTEPRAMTHAATDHAVPDEYLQQARDYRAQGGHRPELVQYLEACGATHDQAEYLADRLDLEIGLAGHARPHDINPTVAKQLDAHAALFDDTAGSHEAPAAVATAADIARAAAHRHATGMAQTAAAGAQPSPIPNSAVVQSVAAIEHGHDAGTAAPAYAAVGAPTPHAPTGAQALAPSPAPVPAPAAVPPLAPAPAPQPGTDASVVAPNAPHHAAPHMPAPDQMHLDWSPHPHGATYDMGPDASPSSVDTLPSAAPAPDVMLGASYSETPHGDTPLSRSTSLAEAIASRTDSASGQGSVDVDLTGRGTGTTSPPPPPSGPRAARAATAEPQQDADWQETTEFGYRIAKSWDEDDPNEAINEAAAMARAGKTHEDIVEHLKTCNVSTGEAEYVAAMTGARRAPKPIAADAKATSKRSFRAKQIILMLFVVGSLLIYMGWSTWDSGAESVRSPLSLAFLGGAFIVKGLHSLVRKR